MKHTPTKFIAAALFCGIHATIATAHAAAPATTNNYLPIGVLRETQRGCVGTCGTTTIGPSCLPERDYRPIVDPQVPEVDGDEGIDARPIDFRHLERKIDTLLRQLAEHAQRLGLTRAEHAELARILVARAVAIAAPGVAGVEALMMPPEGWTFEFFQALQRLHAVALKEGLTRTEVARLRKRLVEALLEVEE
jgi:hypothetical protein